MNRAKTAVSGFLAGAAFMYFSDPNRGRRRRAIGRDKVKAAVHDLANEFDKAGRDLSNRAHGVVSSVRSKVDRSEPDWTVLVDRVRSKVGRAVSHPHAIAVRSDVSGTIVLEGPVLAHEVDELVRSVRSVPGVKEVINRMSVHQEAGGISSLQGGVPRRQYSEFAQQNWTPVLRLGAGAAAGAGFYSAFRHGGALGWAGLAGGTLLLARAISNRGFRQVLGLGDGSVVDFCKTIHIDGPVEEVYAYWSKMENFPKFMTHLREVRDLGNGRWHWVAVGPGGISVPWEAEITEQRPNQLLAWRSIPGSLVRTSGVVRFDPESDGSTRLTVRMSYCPPGGVFGHAVASLFGADPKSEMDDDLVRLKTLIETGKTRAHGHRVTRDEVGMSSNRDPQQTY